MRYEKSNCFIAKSMLMKYISPLTYRFIKAYRDKYIMPPANRNTYFSDAIKDPDEASAIISNAITSDIPCMISRFGSTEMDAIINFKKNHPLSCLRRIYPFWVGKNTKDRMTSLSGFFPTNNKTLSHFADIIVDIVGEIDILGTWIGTENLMPLSKQCKKINLMYLDPFWSKNPWTSCLRGKKVLVVHPFAESIQRQYERRELLFENPDILPQFASLKIIKAVQSIGGESNGFDTWFDALHYMEQKIDECDYDVALIGCGAYGMPLAAHCKRQGKKAVHLGGVLQMLFGILGRRWETEQDIYLKFANEYWVHPLENERPHNAEQVENACYW